MKGFMSQFASGTVGKTLQEGLGTLADKAQGVAKGLAQGLPKNIAPGATVEPARGPASSSGPSMEPQLPLQVPYTTDEETTVLRQQVVQLQVKNGMLQAELEEARGFAEEAAHLRALISDMEVKMVFLLKGADGVQPMMPKVLEAQQKRIEDLTSALAERNGQATGLRADNVRLRCQVEDLMAKMALSARHAEAAHNEQTRELKALLAAAQEEAEQLRATALERSSGAGSGDGGSDEAAAALREQLQHAYTVIKELEEEAQGLRTAAAQVRSDSSSRHGGAGDAYALKWRIADLEEQLEEANEKLQKAERKLGPSAMVDAAALDEEVQKLRAAVEGERRKVADVAAAAAAEAALEAETALKELRKRIAELEKSEKVLVADRDDAERLAAELQGKLAAMQTEHDRALEHAAAAAVSNPATDKAASKAAEASVAELQALLDVAAARAEGLERDLEAAKAQCVVLNRDLTDAMARAATAEDAVAKEREKVVAARAEAAEARGRIAVVEAQLSEALREAAAANQRAKEVDADLVISRLKVESNTERIVAMTEKVAEAESIVEAYKAKEDMIEKLMEEVPKLRGENQQLHAALELAQEETTAARDVAERNQEQAQLANDNVVKLRTHLDKMKERQVRLEAQVAELLAKQVQAADGAAAANGEASSPAVPTVTTASSETQTLIIGTDTNSETFSAAAAAAAAAAGLAQRKRRESAALAMLEEQLGVIESSQESLEQQMKEISSELLPLRKTAGNSPLPPAPMAGVHVKGDGWDEEGWEAWDSDAAASPRPPASGSATAGNGVKAEMVVVEKQVEENYGASSAPEGGSMRVADGISSASVAVAAPDNKSPAAAEMESRLAAYAAELALLQDTVRQLLGCWSGAAATNGSCDGHSPRGGIANGSSPSPNGMASGVVGLGMGAAQEEATVLGGTVVALLGQLQAHFQEATSMRHQLKEAVEELAKLRANGGRDSGHGGCGGSVEDGEEERVGAGLEDMEDIMQNYAAAEQRALAAEAAAAAAASLRRQLEQQLQHSDEAAAAAEANARQLDAELAQAKEAAERAAAIGRELEACHAELAEAQAALAAALEAGATKAAAMESELVKSQARTAAAEARSADALAAAAAAEMRLKEQETRLAVVEQALSAVSHPETTAPISAAVPSPLFAEHLDLVWQVLRTAQNLVHLFHALKASHGSIDDLSHTVSELEALVTKLDIDAAAVTADGGGAPPSYEQSFQSKHIGPAAATLLAAETAAAAVAEEGKPAAADGSTGASHVSADLSRALARSLSASRRASDDSSVRVRLEAAEAAARAAESELRVHVNLAESLRAELGEQQAAMAALRAATVDKEDVEVMEASYRRQIEQLQGYLAKTADKQARQIAALEEEHSQALAAEQALAAAALTAAEERVAGLEVQLEAAWRASAAAEERLATAETAAAEARRLAQDIERGWGERLERLQKINKKRAAELDEARAESSGLTEKLGAMGEQVATLQAALVDTQRQLELERAAAADLRARLGSLQEAGDCAGQEASELRVRIAAAEAQVAELEQRANTAESKLQASEADRSKLADQLVLLHSLREERAAALAALADAQEGSAGMDALRVRCEAAEAARDRAAVELSRVSAMMSNLEARLQQVEDENEDLVAEVDEERRRGAALARTWAGELEALSSLPRDRWPAAVRRLVDGLEGRTGHTVDNSSRGSEGGHSHGHSEEARAAELEALREAAKAAAERTARVEAQAAAANAALDALRRQMDEARAQAEVEARAEAARRLEDLDALRAQLSERGNALELELYETRAQLKAAAVDTQRLQDEIQRLRDKSRELLVEKELEADTLRAQLRQARAAAIGAVVEGDVGQQQVLQQSGQAPLVKSSSSVSLQAQDLADPSTLLALRSRVAVLEHDLEEYKHAYEDAESTHQLRDTAQAALREELLRLRAQLDLSNQDVQYLRAAIISFFESGSLPRDGLVLQVLSRLLRFTPAEMASIAAADHSHRGGRRGLSVAGTALGTAVVQPQGAPASVLASTSTILASVTSRMASVVSGFAHPGQGPATGGFLPQSSFGQRLT